jgi:hypothetical protein
LIGAGARLRARRQRPETKQLFLLASAHRRERAIRIFAEPQAWGLRERSAAQSPEA